MIGFRRTGFGDCPSGVTNAEGDCADTLASMPLFPSDTTVSAPSASATGSAQNPESVSSFLQSFGMPASFFSPAPTTQTFSQWVTANSTLLLVSFAAIGAVMALAGKRR